MNNNYEVTKIAADGLRYTSKQGGSPFQDSSNGATLSCYKCGLHKPRSLGEFKHILGQQRFKCADCVDKAAIHICQFRDYLFETGLTPVTVRKQTAILNAILNIAFRHLDIDRLSPFRGLKIIGEHEHKRSMRIVTPELLLQVKQRLLFRVNPYKLIGLIQLNTGMRLSEPVFARLDDLVLDHPIPHLWVRRNELSNRKTKSSIRAVPLVGSSLYAAQRLLEYAKAQGSEWLVPDYAHYHGSNSCSAILNKHLKDLDFRSHMFRHALIDRMKACNDIPTRLAESITGHYSGGSEFNNYGTVGYTLEQKLEVLKRIEI